MFEMDPEMDFGERLSLWWSCLWRQLLAGLALGVVFVIFVVVIAHPSEWAAAMKHPSTQIFGAIMLLGLLFWICTIPLNGEAVRRGFVAQQLAAPTQFDFGRVFMLGLTTAGWGILASIPVSAVSMPLRMFGHPLGFALANLCLHVLATMYIVLPRQARRLRLQCGYGD